VGPRPLVMSAVDAAGRFGARKTLALVVRDVTPHGLLIVTLRWDTEADLDLHVVQPNKIEIWARNINAYVPPAPGEPPPDPDQISGGGILDFDSNASCQIDGRRQEDVTWKAMPPSGHYLVRVDGFSMCAAPWAHWTVEVTYQEQLIASARGESTEIDTRLPHGAGAGVLAAEFDIP